MQNSSRVFVAGDLNIDLVAQIAGEIALESDTPSRNSFHLGGSPTNMALWLAQAGVQPWLASCIGNDNWGNWALAELQQHGLDTSGVVQLDEQSTGTCVILVDEFGRRTMFPDHGANSYLTLTSNHEAKISLSQALVLSAYSFFNPQTRELAFDAVNVAKTFGVLCVVDAGSVAPIERVGVGLCRSFLSLPDVVIANSDEFAILTEGEHGRTWFNSVGNLIAKNGGGAATWYSFGQEVVSRQPAQVQVVDTTGAGDAFLAGLVSYLVSSPHAGQELAEHALQAGHNLAARAITQVGATPPIGS